VRKNGDKGLPAVLDPITVASFGRFRRLTQAALPLFVMTAVYDLVRFNGWSVGRLVWFETGLFTMILTVAGFDIYGRRRINNPFDEQNPARLILLLLLVDALVQAGFVKLLEMMETLAPGETLGILSTDPASKRGRREWASRAGHTILETKRSGPIWSRECRYLIARKEPEPVFQR
jgi:TusA-related sulfurtransferase